MAVIVKGMDIPLGCCYEDYNGKTGYCPFCDNHDVPYCVLEPSHLVSEELLFIEVDSRPNWCPLVEIPEEEGERMITLSAKEVKDLRLRLGYDGCRNCSHQIEPLRSCQWLEHGEDGQLHFICPRWERKEKNEIHN